MYTLFAILAGAIMSMAIGTYLVKSLIQAFAWWDRRHPSARTMLWDAAYEGALRAGWSEEEAREWAFLVIQEDDEIRGRGKEAK